MVLIKNFQNWPCASTMSVQDLRWPKKYQLLIQCSRPSRNSYDAKTERFFKAFGIVSTRIKMDKWDYLKKPLMELKKVFCFGIVWIPRKPGIRSRPSKILYSQCAVSAHSHSFVKSIMSCLLEWKVIPSFCFTNKIPDDVTATNT